MNKPIKIESDFIRTRQSPKSPEVGNLRVVGYLPIFREMMHF